MNKVLYKRE